jgi:hypothetical protein
MVSELSGSVKRPSSLSASAVADNCVVVATYAKKTPPGLKTLAA